MEAPFAIESMFDGRSHHGSFREHLWHRWRGLLILRRFVCIAMIVIGGIFAIKTYGSGNKFANFISTAFILIGTVGYMRPMIWQMWYERKLRKHPAYGTVIKYEFNHDGIIIDGVSGRVNVPWSQFSEVVKTETGLLLYQNKKDYIWIPSYDFEEWEMAHVVSMSKHHS
jgi:hypothetical protein